MNILAGLYRADEEQILIHGKPVTFRSRDAIAHGIGMVHQHFMLVESQTVAENIILGLDEPRFWLDMAGVAQKIAAMASVTAWPSTRRKSGSSPSVSSSASKS